MSTNEEMMNYLEAKIRQDEAQIAELEKALWNLLDRVGRRDVMDFLAVPTRIELLKVADESRLALADIADATPGGVWAMPSPEIPHNEAGVPVIPEDAPGGPKEVGEDFRDALNRLEKKGGT